MDQPVLTISATRPKDKPARILAEKGIVILPVEEEDDVDRFFLSKRLVIERRTKNSFIQGIIDKTLFTSALYLRENFEIPLLIIEDELNMEHSSFNPQALRGALSSMIIQYGINVLSTPSVGETTALIAMITRQEQIGIPEVSLVPKRKAADLPDLQRRVIEMLPGCGMSMARMLLQHFGSIKRIVDATENEIRSIRGIGKKKAEEIFKVLNAEYRSVDTEKQLEDAIEAESVLLFSQSVTLIDRQHYIFTEKGERHFIDLVFHDPDENKLFLVELKRGKLYQEHEEQLRKYMLHANQSPLLRSYLDNDAWIYGILATVEPCDYMPQSRIITACVVDREKAIEVISKLRKQRLKSGL
jgi:ERCC4-type nuclease